MTSEERLQLTERPHLVEHDRREIEAAWMAEVERRFAEHDDGMLESVRWSEARERIFSKPHRKS